MPRHVSTTEAKAQFSTLIRAVERDDEEIVVEAHGRPRVALVSIRAYEEVLAWRDYERRKQALADLRALQRRVSEREANRDLTPEQAEALADRFVREVVEEMFAEGTLRYADEDEPTAERSPRHERPDLVSPRS